MAQKKSGTRATGAKRASRPATKVPSSASPKARGGSAALDAGKRTSTKKPAGATTRRSTPSAKSNQAPSKTGASGASTRKRTLPGTTPSKAGATEPKRKRVTRKQAAEETKKYRSKAEKYKNDAEATDQLLKDAQEKAKKQKGPLSGRFDDIMTLIRLVRAYVKGEYRDVPWETIALAIGALIYFISPVDLIPDPIPVVGYIDDAAVIGFVVASIYTDLNNFRDWEEAQKAA